MMAKTNGFALLRRIRMISLGAVAIIVAGALASGPASAQGNPPPAEQRILFAPDLGITPDPTSPDHTTIAAQNLGAASTRYIALYFGEGEKWDFDRGINPDQSITPCENCRFLGAVCSPSIAPGRVWRAPMLPDFEDQDPRAPIRSARSYVSSIVYSVDDGPASRHGQAWQDYLAANDFAPETSTADLLCSTLVERLQEAPPAPDDLFEHDKMLCDLSRRMHIAFLDGSELPGLAGLEAKFARGMQSVGSVAIAHQTVGDRGLLSDDRNGITRYSALDIDETGLGEAPREQYIYSIPGIYLSTFEAHQGSIMLQNIGRECTTISLGASLSLRGPIDDSPLSLELAPGASRFLSLANVFRDTEGNGTIRIRSEQPLAIVAHNHAYNTVSSRRASLDLRADDEQVAGLTWAIPRAYQEPKPPQPAITGLETNIAIFSHGDDLDLAIINTQAEGVLPRVARQPIGTLNQLLLQIGLGLDKGGPGWAWIHGDTAPVQVGFESFRMATDLPAPTDTWAATAQAFKPQSPMPEPYSLGLSDMGGPAFGSAVGQVITPTQTLTDALTARIAIQNVRPAIAQVAIDSYSDACGYLGTRPLQILPMQSSTLLASELPGAAWAANSHVLRVLEGEVVALSEIIRDEPRTLAAAMPDYSTAHMAQRAEGAPEPAAPAPAELGLTPSLIRESLPQGSPAFTRTLSLSDIRNSGRCLSYQIEMDGPTGWLKVSPDHGPIPSQPFAQIDPSSLEPGSYQAEIKFFSPEPAVASNPVTLRVELEIKPAEEPMPSIYLPVLMRDFIPDQ